MSTTVETGINWSNENGVVTIFESKGEKIGKQWAINGLNDSFMTPAHPETVSDEIRELIALDVAAGNGDKIDYVGINSRYAVILVLEGVLTLTQLAQAEETADRIVVMLRLDGQERKVIITEAPACAAATFDVNGEIV